MNKRHVIAGSMLAVVVGLVVFNLGLIAGTENKGPLVIYFPSEDDFSNSNQGTANFEFRFPETNFKVGEEIADILMFLDSKEIEGLKVLYNQKERTLSAGIPPLVVENVDLLDGKVHKIVYMFNRNQERQSVSLDGNLLEVGEYLGGVTVLTGYVTYGEFNVVESNFQHIEINFE